jgi:hypothetical protein
MPAVPGVGIGTVAGSVVDRLIRMRASGFAERAFRAQREAVACGDEMLVGAKEVSARAADHPDLLGKFELRCPYRLQSEYSRI